MDAHEDPNEAPVETDVGERARAELASAPDDDAARLRVLDELYSRLEAELDRDLGASGSTRY
jgi:hypothetical protein